VHALGIARDAELPGGFELDQEFQPVPLGRPGPGEAMAARPETHLVRGTVADEAALDELRTHPEVASAWIDTPIAPFAKDATADPAVNPADGPGSCPIPPCDCSPGTAHGTIADVAHYLEVDQIWAAGFRGTGMVIGIVDGGITAAGRPVQAGETPNRIPRVIDGYPSNWGTTAKAWGDHGNMTSTDALGMAPDAQIYDLRISDASGSFISNALQAFQWAIDRHRVDGTPQVLSNSWGIFQQSWDPAYATDPNHPFTQKVVEAITEGILVLFAAGNCGDTCPDGRCGPDAGPGRDIWGANGHPLVMTVGAVNKDEQFVGYSSTGPAALDPHKPDFCSITHFRGYEPSDSGTSAATPILAGAVALLKQAHPTATQASIKSCLQSTAKDIGPAGWDQWAGAGIVRPHQAFGCLTFHPPHTLLPPCPVTLTPGCGPTLMAPCHPTINPPCQITLSAACPPHTITAICGHITTTPQLCPVATATPTCPPRTLPPICPPLTLPPGCPPPPQTLPPTCPPVTLIGPACGHVTLAGCPQPTLVGPACGHVTLAGCPRVTLVGCPVATALPACPPITAGGCPQPSLACGPIPGPVPGQGFSAGEYWAG
jgi:Subtilase family